MPGKREGSSPVILDDGMTVGTPITVKNETATPVRVFIPAPPEAEAGVLVDPYEHVTITNLDGEQHYKVLRGIWVEVPPNVFEQLRNKYPNL